MTDSIEITLAQKDFEVLMDQADRGGYKDLDELINEIVADYLAKELASES